MRVLNAAVRGALLATAIVLLGASLLALRASSQQPAPPEAVEQIRPKQTERIAALEKTLSHATLAGRFTITGQKGEGPAEDRYDLGEVKHLGNDQWSIPVRIRYAEHDLQIPITVPIRWADDTPVISVDDLAIPGLGSFTARVMIYRDHYAGFWTGHDHGGHLYGMVQHGKKDAGSNKK